MTLDKKEEWRTIDGTNGRYMVSSLGRVLSLPNSKRKTAKMMVGKIEKSGYHRVGIVYGSKLRLRPIHRLVAEAFISNPLGLLQVNHIDENKANNHVTNLEWVTAKQNCNHGTRKERIRRAQWNTNHARRVVQKDKSGIIVAEYPSTAEIPRASEGRFKRANVCHCLAGEMPYAYGFKWEYVK